MTNCINCGAEISENQYKNFKGMCPECIRLNPMKKQAENENIIGIAICIFVLIVVIISIIGYMTSIQNAP